MVDPREKKYLKKETYLTSNYGGKADTVRPMSIGFLSGFASSTNRENPLKIGRSATNVVKM